MKEVIGGDKDLLAEILQSFIDEAEPLAQSVLAAAQEGRLDMLGRAAPTINASARDFGDSALAALCADVELRSKRGTVVNVITCSEQIAQGCMALKEELAAYIGTELNEGVP
jgi:HPt (histidine-containing phosphotransfer) domain-containing protein